MPDSASKTLFLGFVSIWFTVIFYLIGLHFDVFEPFTVYLADILYTCVIQAACPRELFKVWESVPFLASEDAGRSCWSLSSFTINIFASSRMHLTPSFP